MKVAVVTPTIGSEYLYRCLESVQNQSYTDLKHYIFIDGRAHKFLVEDLIFNALRDSKNKNALEKVYMTDNVGKGWYGHRAYAACSFLVNADVICYLDEDNWLEEDHVKQIVDVLSAGNQWAYSLRKIYTKDEEFICEDNCESLGKWCSAYNENVFHIDTSCFGVRRDVTVNIGHSWYGQWGADRQFFAALRKYYPNYDCTNEYSLCYRLDGNPNSVTKEFFEKGNKINFNKYSGKYPWAEHSLTVKVAPGVSVRM